MDAQAKTVRDSRLDTIGFVGELASHVKDPLVKAVKATLAGKSAARGEGDVFRGLLIPGVETSVDPEGWHRAWTDKRITRAQYFEGLRVSVEKARALLSQKDFDAIAAERPKADALRVERIEKGSVDLVLALTHLTEQVQQRKAA